MVGVCKQDDYLYPKLTAKEHLILWADLRGVKDSDIERVVQEWLESVDLHEVQNGYSSGFSGGMKRRLSVALSTVGDRPFIILDEPTTGKDDHLSSLILSSLEHVPQPPFSLRNGSCQPSLCLESC